jgi:hypothetical protein
MIFSNLVLFYHNFWLKAGFVSCFGDVPRVELGVYEYARYYFGGIWGLRNWKRMKEPWLLKSYEGNRGYGAIEVLERA